MVQEQSTFDNALSQSNVVSQPQSADELEDWLAKHCNAADQSTNLTTFRGKKKDQNGNIIREGSWYLFDRHRETFADHFVRIYDQCSSNRSLPCLNMLIPAGDRWRCKPYLDVDFANARVYQLFLQHIELSRDEFYREVRRCFAKFVLPLAQNHETDEEVHDSVIAFSKQPSNDHKFHLMYVGKEDITWTKEEMKERLYKVARFMNTYFRMEELHKKLPIMVKTN